MCQKVGSSKKLFQMENKLEDNFCIFEKSIFKSFVLL